MMKIRSVRRAMGSVPPENIFIIVDELENQLGKCWVETHDCGQTMSSRPFEVCIHTQAEENLSDSGYRQLVGTALARGIELVTQQKKNARIYAECDVDDRERLELLTSAGLNADEAVVSMKRKMSGLISSVPEPQGCVLVCDSLANEREREFFIERQKVAFGRENAAEWLDEITQKRGMKRMMLVHDQGMAAELVCWYEPESRCGVIGMVYTVPAWRRKGAASFLMESARQYFWKHGVKECRIEVRTRMKSVIRMAASVGYAREKVLYHRPGTDIDMQIVPPKKRVIRRKNTAE